MERRSVGDGRYELLEQIGEGGMASVWRAHDRRLGVERAVKLMRPQLTSASARTRFDREARLMARLEHPHVVPVHDVGSDGDVWYMVMSLLRSGSVAGHVDAFGPLAPRQACQVVQSVLDALQAAHAAGIVHRDVKPQNVLIDDRGEVRLADFGIARSTDRSMTHTGAVLGTFAFMPPEQRVNSKDADARSDLYAVGALLVAVLLGELPQDLFHPAALAAQAERIPAPLRPFVERCTRFTPAERYDDAAAALAALRAAAEALPPDPPE
ncbi:MAG: serine/threonine-protein kinase, partial [Myxococcota bacterium]